MCVLFKSLGIIASEQPKMTIGGLQAIQILFLIMDYIKHFKSEFPCGIQDVKYS